MAEGTPIGALAVRIGADASELISELKKAEKALTSKERALKAAATAATLLASAAAAAGAALFTLVKSAAASADEMGKMSQKVGISVESLSALRHAAKMSDVSIEELSTGLRHLSKFMVENGQAGQSVEERLMQIADQFDGMVDGPRKTALAIQMFGKAGNELIPFLNQGRAGIEALKNEAQALGIVISTDAAKAAEAFNDNMTRLKGAVEGVRNEIARELLPKMTELTQQMLDGQRIAGGFWNALLQFAGINPFRSTGGNIKELQRDLEELANSRTTLANLKGYEAQLAQIDRQIKVTENRIKFLKDMQLREALALGGPDSLDARDLMARGQPRKKSQGPATPEELKAIEDRERQIREILHRVREEEDRRELDQIKLKNEELLKQEQDALAARLALIDYEQAEAIRRGEEELEIAKQHQAELDRIERHGIQSRADFEKATMQQRAKSIFGDLAAMTAGVAQHSRKMFELNKVAGIANAIVNTAEGVTKALAKYPPPLSFAMAAAQAAAGLVQIQAIRNATFQGGGGGVAPSAVGTPAPAVTPVGGESAGGGRGGGGQTTVVNIKGDLFGQKQVRDLLEQIVETTRDGGRVVIG